MKRILAVGMLIFLFILLVGCMNQFSRYPHANLFDENWQRLVETNPDHWTSGASAWFLGAEPKVSPAVYKDQVLGAISESATSPLMPGLAEFNKIRVEGPFQVQLFGSEDHNSVQLLGPESGVRQAVVEVRGDTLFISAAPDAENVADMQAVVIRIGVVDLKKLTASGSGRIEGKLTSSALVLKSEGNSNIYLAGDIHLKEIRHAGNGRVNIFGAVSSALDIYTAGNGTLNISGDLGLRCVYHHGTGDINIIGAKGGALKVYADGSGKVGIYGNVRIVEITAKDKTCVYAYYVYGNALYVYTSGSAHVGLAGSVDSLEVNTSDISQFFGRCLQSRFAYVRARHSSHVNVTASERIYAAASDNASVYYFGSPAILTEFEKGNGTIIPIWNGPSHIVYKDESVAVIPKKPIYLQPKKVHQRTKIRRVRKVS